jgi:peptidyl-prolyl cis-trans isomerase C/peptidyl-prolyl cis-trans isomerase D
VRLFLFAAFYFLVSLSQAQVLAKVGNKEITLKEFEEKYALLKNQVLEMPDKKKFLDDLISYEVGVQEAQKRGLDQDPAIRERLRQELYKGFIEKELAPKTIKITATEAEMKSYYSRNPELKANQIMIEVRPDATAEQKKEVRKRAQEIFDTVRKSQRKFEDLVKIYSDDPLSSKSGGDIGWQTRLTLYPSIYAPVSKLAVGQVSPLIETPFGFFIVKLTGKKTYNDADHAMLRLAVQEEKKKALFDQFISSLRSKYKIQVNKAALGQ